MENWMLIINRFPCYLLGQTNHFPVLVSLMEQFLSGGVHLKNLWLPWWNGACTSYLIHGHADHLDHHYNKINNQSRTRPAPQIILNCSNTFVQPYTLSPRPVPWHLYLHWLYSRRPYFHLLISANMSTIFHLILVVDYWTCCSSTTIAQYHTHTQSHQSHPRNHLVLVSSTRLHTQGILETQHIEHINIQLNSIPEAVHILSSQ